MKIKFKYARTVFRFINNIAIDDDKWGKILGRAKNPFVKIIDIKKKNGDDK